MPPSPRRLEIRFARGPSVAQREAARLAGKMAKLGVEVRGEDPLAVSFGVTSVELSSATELWRLVLPWRSSSLWIDGVPVPPLDRLHILSVLHCAAYAAVLAAPRRWCESGPGHPATWPGGVGVRCRHFMERWGHRLGERPSAVTLAVRAFQDGAARCPFFDLEELERRGDEPPLGPTPPIDDVLARLLGRRR